jgi:hypothetical protein
MATAPPKRSWANVARIPPKPNVILHVDSLYKDAEPPSSGFINHCIGQAKRNFYPRYNPRFNVQYNEGTAEYYNHLRHQQFDEGWEEFQFDNLTSPSYYLVSTFEEEMLYRMTDPTNADYIKMKSDFEWIAQQLSCNIVVYLGHIEVCATFIEDTYKKILEKMKPNPIFNKTIFLIVACYGDQRAYEYNTNPKYKFFQDRNVAFFGFTDFMHFYAGEIYSCAQPLGKVMDFSCEYEGIEEDLQVLLQNYKMPYSEFDKENPLFKCCHARLESVYKAFVDELLKRETTKYTKENLLEKFRAFAERGDRSVLTEDYVKIKPSDGTFCADETACPLENPFIEEKNILNDFDRRNKVRKLYEELNSLLLAGNHPLEKGERFLRRIANLVGDEQKVFTYEKKGQDPLLFFITSMHLRTREKRTFDILSFIIDKYGKKLNFALISGYSNATIVGHIYNAPIFNEDQKYSLLKKIMISMGDTVDRDLLFLRYDKKRGSIIQNRYLSIYSPIFKLFIQTFGPKLKNMPFYINAYTRGNLLHKLMAEYPPPNNSSRSTNFEICVEGLLLNGIDPNERLVVDVEEKERLANNSGQNINTLSDLPKLRPLEMHLIFYNPPYNEKTFKLFFKYGMTNENNLLNVEIETWKRFSNPENIEALESYQKILQGLLERILNDSYDYQQNNNAYYPQYGGRRRRGSYSSNDSYYNRRNYNNNNGHGYYSNTNNEGNPYYYYHRLTAQEKQIVEDKFNIIKEFRYVHPTIRVNIEEFLRLVSTIRAYPTDVNLRKPLIDTITLFEECKRIRRAVGKHGSKIKRTRKQNKNTFNKTLKANLNNLNLRIDPEKFVNKLMEEILELAKDSKFTKDEKKEFKARPITIKKMSISPLEKLAQLRDLLARMKGILNSR